MNFDLLVEKLTDDVVSKIIELFKQDRSLTEISRELGISYMTVRKQLKQATSKGIIDYNPKDISPLTEEEKTKIILLKKQGKPNFEIARELGIHSATVTKQLKLAASKDLVNYKPQNTPPLTEEEKAKIILLKTQGKPNNEIARELDINITTVIRQLKKAASKGLVNYKPRTITSRRLTEEEKTRIINLFKQDKSSTEIERELGINRTTVIKYLKQAASKGLIDYTPKNVLHVTEEQKTKIILLKKQGKLNFEIARELDIEPDTVIKHLKQAASKGLIDYTPKNVLPLTEEQKTKIILLKNQGKTNFEIARELDINISTVLKIINSLDPDTLDDLGMFFKKTKRGKRIIPMLGSFKDYFNREEESKEKLNDDEYDKKPKKFDRQMMISILKSTIQNRKYFENKPILRIMSLPHNYLAEKDLLKELNPGKIESFGFNIPKYEDDQIKYGVDVYEETKGRIIPYLLIKDANRAILNQDKIVFKKITPNKYYGYDLIEPITPEFNSFDIIDLDYKGIPGSANMTVGNNNPWLPPIVAAKKYLKRNGVLMITYLGDTWRKQEAGKHMIQSMLSREGSVLKKYEDYITPDSNLYIDPDKPDSNIIRSLAKRKDKEETVKKHYAVAAKAGNLYTKNILKLAEEQGVKLKVIHRNIYPGGATSFMYRIGLQKID